MKEVNSLLIADDHPIFRMGLKDILHSIFPKAVIYECQDGAEAFEGILMHEPEVSILDINMPKLDGLNVCRQVLKQKPESKIIMLTMYNEKEMIKSAMQSGALGYILKENAIEEITECILTVLEGNKYSGIALQPYLPELSHEDKKKQKLINDLKSLKHIELKTLKMVIRNKSTREIAELLFLAEKTVENYRSRICQKLGLPPRNNSLVKWINENKELLSYYINKVGDDQP